jgi:hypothetical protein
MHPGPAIHPSCHLLKSVVRTYENAFTNIAFSAEALALLGNLSISILSLRSLATIIWFSV